MICIFVVSLFSMCWAQGPIPAYNPGNVRVDSYGGYRGILLAIEGSVQHSTSIVPNLKEYMKLLSQALSKATKKESERYIQEVTVLLPGTWPKDSSCARITTETQNSANIIVQADTEQWGSAPHTLRFDSQCGQAGVGIVLPESFVASQSTARQHGADIGKLMLKQWAIYRYGIFDESTSNNDNRSSCLWFEGGAVFPIHCSRGIQGSTVTAPNGGACYFEPHRNQPDGVNASIMYRHDLEEVDQFCDNEGYGVEHNFAIPNEHNDRCGGRSVWEVLRNHIDFYTRIKRDVTQGTAPSITFRCVQEDISPRIVLTMDVSASMDNENRLQRMRTDVRLFIQSITCKDTRIGLVEFSNSSETKHELVRLGGDRNLQSLISAIPTKTLDRTCIGCGITEAIRVLRRSGSTNGGVIVVFSDGLENQAPYVTDVTTALLQEGVVAYSILLSSIAKNHSLGALSKRTGGKSCTYSDTQHSTYYDCLASILQDRSPRSAPVQVLSTLLSTPPQKRTVGTVYIDSDLTDSLQLIITWDEGYRAACSTISVRLTSPSDVIITSDSSRYDMDFGLRTITMDMSSVEAGLWSYEISNNHPYERCQVRLLLEGFMDNDACGGDVPGANQPVTMSAMVQPQIIMVTPENTPHENAIRLYARLQKGSNPVINADVAAVFETSDNREISIALLDNGAGADFAANDGIYSRYYIDYYGNGLYNAKFNANWTITTSLKRTKRAYGRSGSQLPQGSGSDVVNLPPFQRTYPGQVVQVYNHGLGISTKESIFPPSTVIDLKVVNIDEENREVELVWTASGEHLDEGTASYYELRITSDARIFHSQFSSAALITTDMLTFGRLDKPGVFGTLERVRIRFTNDSAFYPDRQTLYYMSLTAVNKYEKASAPSNLALVMFTSEAKTILGIPFLLFYLLIALVIFVVFLLLLAVIAAVVVKKRTNLSEKSDDAENGLETASGAVAASAVSGTLTGAVGSNSIGSSKGKDHGSQKSSSRRKRLSDKIRRSQGLLNYIATSISKKKNSNNSSTKEKKVTFGNSVKRKPWAAPDEPLQNHNYSHRLFGEAALSPEVEVTNAVYVVSSQIKK